MLSRMLGQIQTWERLILSPWWDRHSSPSWGCEDEGTQIWKQQTCVPSLSGGPQIQVSPCPPHKDAHLDWGLPKCRMSLSPGPEASTPILGYGPVLRFEGDVNVGRHRPTDVRTSFLPLVSLGSTAVYLHTEQGAMRLGLAFAIRFSRASLSSLQVTSLFSSSSVFLSPSLTPPGTEG